LNYFFVGSFIEAGSMYTKQTPKLRGQILPSR
jgi:hypothetical protein